MAKEDVTLKSTLEYIYLKVVKLELRKYRQAYLLLQGHVEMAYLMSDKF